MRLFQDSATRGRGKWRRIRAVVAGNFIRGLPMNHREGGSNSGEVGGRGDEAADGGRRGEERKMMKAFIGKNIGDIEGRSSWNLNDRGDLVCLGDQNPDSSHRRGQTATCGVRSFHKPQPEQPRDPVTDKKTLQAESGRPTARADKSCDRPAHPASVICARFNTQPTSRPFDKKMQIRFHS